MILLDTDTVSLLLRTPENYPNLVRRIRKTPGDDIYISAITVGEIMEGALALVRKLQPKDQESVGYTLLVEYFQSLKKFAILPYDSNAETRFQEFPDFSEIPGLKFEDWTE